MKIIIQEEFDQTKPNDAGMRIFGAFTDFANIKSFGERCRFGERCSFGKGCECKEGINIFLLANNLIPIENKIIIYELNKTYGTLPYLRYRTENFENIKRLEVDIDDIIIEPYSIGEIIRENRTYKRRIRKNK
jgi:hypothetical protein